MILSDLGIRQQLDLGNLVIDPAPRDWQIQPASVDLTLGRGFMSPYDDKEIDQDAYLIAPGECVLATTQESFKIPLHLVARVEGKSSWGRKFLMIHSTAGFVDPGFQGKITLELVNLSKVAQLLKAGMPIAQMSFQRTDVPVERPYGTPGLNSRYQGQSTVTPTADAWT